MKNKITMFCRKARIKADAVLNDKSGDFITDHLGAFVVGVIVIGIFIAAVTGWLPNFLQDVFDYMSDSLLP